MAVTALALTLFEEQSGRLLGCWLLCPAARYASFWNRRTNRIGRSHLSAPAWRDIEAEIAGPMGPGRVGPTSAIGQALLPSNLTQWAVLEQRAVIAIDTDATDITPMVEMSNRLDTALLATAA